SPPGRAGSAAARRRRATRSCAQSRPAPRRRRRAGARRPAGRSRPPANGVELPFSDALQLVEAAVLEYELRACDEILHGAGDQHLARFCLLRHPGSDRNGDSARLRPHQLALAGVETGTDLEPDRLHVLDQRASTLDRAARAIECGEEAVPRSVDLVAAELVQPAADDRMMAL